jgi:DNA-binding response OmpR family regulator
MAITTPRILLVEDDVLLGEGLSLSLKLEGYDIHWEKKAQSGFEAFQQNKFDLVILDIGLPDGLGTDICKNIRSGNTEVGVIFLTARTDEDTVVRGLELGANDFVKKPFSHKELMARIKVLLRSKLGLHKEIKTGHLVLNSDQRQATYKGVPLSLNRRQFDILSFFLNHMNQIITRDQLLVHLNSDGEVFDRTIDSHVSQLRKILKKNEVNEIIISSIYGVGYRLEIDE